MTSRKNEQIDENLRRVYNELLDEDLPDRFRDLLDKLREKENPSHDGASPSNDGATG